MYIENMYETDSQRNMTRQHTTTTTTTTTTTRKARQENCSSRPRARSASSTRQHHRRSASMDANTKKTQNNNNNNSSKQNNSKRLSPLTPISLLCYTVINRDEILLQKLLSNYPSEVNMLSAEGVAPLHLASMDGDTNIMKILLKNGAKLDVRDCENRSALEYAVLSGQFDAAQFLIQSGCDSTLIRDGYSLC